MNPKEGTKSGNPVPGNDNNPSLNVFLDDIRDEGINVTKNWADVWFTAIKYAWGQQLEGWKLKENWEYAVVNRIYPLMFQTIAKLAGNNPKIMTKAWDDEKEGTTEFAEKWAGHLQYLWESPYELNMRLKLIKGLLDCAVFGYMVGYGQWDHKPKGGWDTTEKRWKGKSQLKFIHPGLFWCDPSAENIYDAENCGMKRRVKLEWATNRWPKHKEAITAEAYTSDDPKFMASDLISYKDQKGSTLSISRQNMFSKLVSLIINKGVATGAQPNEETGTEQQKYVDVEQIYWRDYSERHVKIKDNLPEDVMLRQGNIIKEEVTGFYLDAKTKQPIKDYPTQVTDEYDEPIYPNGRFVLRVNRTILNPQTKEDKDIHKDFAEGQVYKESRWPFHIMPYHILPHMWQGGNAIEMARNNNDILNLTVSSMFNQVRRTADPTKIIEAGALAKGRNGKTRSTRDDITGLGRILIAARGKLDKFRDYDTPDIDPAVFTLAEAMKKDIDAQEFMHPVARGESEKGQQTKAEIVRLNQNSLDYVGLQGIFLDKWIDDSMTLVAEICQRYYEPGELMKIISGEEKSGMRIPQEALDVMFDVNIEPGSTLPFDEQKKQNEYATAYQMLENPVPNPMIEDMLRVLNISKRKEILAKYQGLQLFRQFMQMGKLLAQAQGEPEVQAIIAQLVAIPGMEQLMQLLLQAGQLAPQANVQ